MHSKDLIGRTFSRLTVVEKLPSKDNKVVWRCRCECGGTVDTLSYSLNAGLTRSCGCLRREVVGKLHKTHGMKQTPEYMSWCGIKARCFNPKSKQFKDYGGRGITCDPRWRDSFEAFLEDMGPKPSPGHEIDRYPDNDGDYGSGNCRWATREENSNNKRSNVRITAFGETKTAAQWSRDPRCRVTEWALWFRIAKSGWEPERAITEPSKEIAPPRGSVEAFGESKSLAEWSRDPRCAVDYGTLKLRTARGGWDAEKAILTPPGDCGVTTSATAFGETKPVSEWARDPRCAVAYRTLLARIKGKNWGPEDAITTPNLGIGGKQNGG